MHPISAMVRKGPNQTPGANSPSLAPSKSLPRPRVPISRKQFIFNTFEDPQFSSIAKMINIFVLALIMFSTTTFLLETLPELDPNIVKDTDPEKADNLEVFWQTCETVVVSIFTAEYLIRLVTCPKISSFVVQKLNIVDVLAIVPYYIELILNVAGSGGSGVSKLRFLRTIRLFRVFRLFKLSKHSEHFVVFVETLRKSRDALLMLTFILCLTVIIFAGIMHILEKADKVMVPHPTEPGVFLELYQRADGTLVTYDPFRSVPEAAWWAIATLTTVGYGDAVPITGSGKAVAPIAMLAGILTIAMPLGIIGENLMESYRRSSQLTQPKPGDSIVPQTADDEEPHSLKDMVTLVGQTREEIGFLFMNMEDMILDLRGAPDDRRAFNTVEQNMFDTVMRGLSSLEQHLTTVAEEAATGGVTSGPSTPMSISPSQPRVLA